MIRRPVPLMPRFFHAFKRPELEFRRDAVRLGVLDLLDFPGGGTRWIESCQTGQLLRVPHGARAAAGQTPHK